MILIGPFFLGFKSVKKNEHFSYVPDRLGVLKINFLLEIIISKPVMFDKIFKFFLTLSEPKGKEPISESVDYLIRNYTSRTE